MHVAAKAQIAKSNALTTILSAGITVGILDTFLAMALWQIGPGVVYKSVASGWLGRAAYRGGLGTAALGMFSHFFIATTAAAAFWVLAQNVSVLRDRLARYWLPLGLAYGVWVYYFMQLVVLPLSNVSKAGSEPTWRVFGSIVGHAFLVGLPIAWFVTHDLKAKEKSWRNSPPA